MSATFSSGPAQATSQPLALPAFGAIEPERVLAQDDLFAVVRDKYPVAAGHTLIIPRRAVTRFQDLDAAEKTRLMAWVDWAEEHLQATLVPSPGGFNLGVNDGKAAGQTMPQFHFHVIPRYAGDMDDPRGGVRWVIPAKARYWQERGESCCDRELPFAGKPKGERSSGIERVEERELGRERGGGRKGPGRQRGQGHSRSK